MSRDVHCFKHGQTTDINRHVVHIAVFWFLACTVHLDSVSRRQAKCRDNIRRNDSVRCSSVNQQPRTHWVGYWLTLFFPGAPLGSADANQDRYNGTVIGDISIHAGHKFTIVGRRSQTGSVARIWRTINPVRPNRR